MNNATTLPSPTLTLDEQHAVFCRNRFLAMPLAGTIAWTAIGVAGALLSPRAAVLAVFIGTGVIFYLGMGLARLTGEDLLGRQRKGNLFDRLFLLAIFQACLVFAIAIPFLRADWTSLPMTIGILTGLMWIPFAGLIGHWIGLFHGVARTALVLAAWYAFPNHRFLAIPAVIVAVYLVTIVVLERRWRKIKHTA